MQCSKVDGRIYIYIYTTSIVANRYQHEILHVSLEVKSMARRKSTEIDWLSQLFDQMGYETIRYLEACMMTAVVS